MTGFGFNPRSAVAHLLKADPALAEVIGAVGPFAMQLKASRSLFGALAEAIVYQQLSNKAAATIFGRVCVHFPRGHVGLTPERLLALSDARIRGAGISRPKLKSLRDLARRSASGEVPTLTQARRLSDGEIARRLGAPHESREVGQALGRNPIAIIVPCHRVLGADGKMGGFSATGGVAIKRRILEIEGAAAVGAGPLFAGLQPRNG